MNKYSFHKNLTLFHMQPTTQVVFAMHPIHSIEILITTLPRFFLRGGSVTTCDTWVFWFETHGTVFP